MRAEFIRSGDPIKSLNIGKDSLYAKTKIFDSLIKLGIKSSQLDWGKDKDIKKRKVIDNIYKIKEIIDKLHNLGLNYEKIEIMKYDHLNIKIIQVIDTNRVIAECLSIEDAHNIASVFKKFNIENDYEDRYKFEKGSAYIYINLYDNFLDNLAENRKKYKK